LGYKGYAGYIFGIYLAYTWYIHGVLFQTYHTLYRSTAKH